MTDSQQLRESIWELVYGLLSDEESKALIARIKSDPQAARLYADVRLQADLVGQVRGGGRAAAAESSGTGAISKIRSDQRDWPGECGNPGRGARTGRAAGCQAGGAGSKGIGSGSICPC